MSQFPGQPQFGSAPTTQPTKLKEIQPQTNLPDPRVKRYLTIGVLILVLVAIVFAFKKYPKTAKTAGVLVLVALVIKGLINYNKYGNLIGWR